MLKPLSCRPVPSSPRTPLCLPTTYFRRHPNSKIFHFRLQPNLPFTTAAKSPFPFLLMIRSSMATLYNSSSMRSNDSGPLALIPFPPFPYFHSHPHQPLLVVLGSSNTDIYLAIHRLLKREKHLHQDRPNPPIKVPTRLCSTKLLYPTHFIGQVGHDGHGKHITDGLYSCGIHSHVSRPSLMPPPATPSMIQSSCQNSVIIVREVNVSS